MPATLQQLLTVLTPFQNFQGLVTTLAGVGFPNTTNWTTGTVPSALLQTFGFPLTDLQQSRFNFAAGGLLDYAALAGRPWLELHADQVFDNQAFPAVATVLNETFTDTGNQGPFTIAPGGAGVSVGPGQTIYRTTNSVNVILPLGGSVVIPVRAPNPGSAGNVPDGSLTFFAAGRLPGVTVSNVGPSIVVAGTDAESDAALTQRCRTKWALLSSGSPAPTYVNWSLFAGAGQVGKVKIIVNDDLSDPGLVKVYLGSPAGGGVAPAVVTAVQNFIAPIDIAGARTGSRIPETAKCLVFTAVPKVIFIKATINVYPSFNNAGFITNLASDIATYQANFPIGGVQGNPPLVGYVPASRINQLLLNRSGVVLSPAQDIFNNNLQLSLDGITFLPSMTNILLGNVDAVTFDISNVSLASVPVPS